MAKDRTAAEYRRAVAVWAVVVGAVGVCVGVVLGAAQWVFGIVGGSAVGLGDVAGYGVFGGLIGAVTGGILGAFVSRPRDVGSATGGRTSDDGDSDGFAVQRWAPGGPGGDR